MLVKISWHDGLVLDSFESLFVDAGHLIKRAMLCRQFMMLRAKK